MNIQLTVGLGALLLLSGCWGDSSSSFGTTTQQDIIETPLPITPPVTANEEERFTDTDLDGVVDSEDNCPQTSTNTEVSADGCFASLRIQAEDYLESMDLTEGNGGAQYKSGNVDIFTAGDTDGGYAIRDNQASEWQSYNISLPEGDYEIHSRVSSANGEGEYSLYLDDQLIVADSLTHSTGGINSWSTRRLGKFNVAAGQYSFKVIIDEEGLDLNWFKFVAVGVTTACDGGKPTEGLFECEISPLTAEQTVTSEDRVFYQMNYSTIGRDNAFQKVTAQLDHIQSLKVNTLWLMPIHPRGATSTASFNLNYLSPDREHSLSPYSVSDYLTIEENLGDLNDLRMLIDEAHKRGIAVILDWVANHTSWKNPWLVNKDWYTQVDNLVVSPQEQSWFDVADLNYDNPQMRAAMIDSMLYWIQQGIDGFRCDYTAGVPLDFWQTAIEQIRQVNPNAVMLAEGTINDLTAGFDFTFSWDENTNVKHAFETGNATLVSAQPQLAAGKHLLRYSTNHDLTANGTEKNPIEIACTQIESTLGDCSGYPEKIQQGAIAQFAVHLFYGDVPLIYSGQEVGEEKKTSFYVDDVVDWSKNLTTFEEYQRLMAFYANSDTVKNGEALRYDNTSIVAIQKTTETERFVMLNNVSAVDSNYVIPDELKGDYVDVLSGQGVTLDGDYVFSGFEYLLLTQEYSPPETGPVYAEQLWIKGNFNSWDAGNDIDALTYIGNSTYVGTVNIQTTENSYFKITNSDLTWESGAGVIATLGEPMTFAISENGPVDAAQLQVTETGLYSFTLNASNRNAPILTISKDVATYPGSNLYVRGFDGDWDAHDGTQMTYVGAGYYAYDILAAGDLNKGFKVANADWNAPNSGGTTVTLGGKYATTAQSDAGITLAGLTEETEIRIIYHAINDSTHEGEVAVIVNDKPQETGPTYAEQLWIKGNFNSWDAGNDIDALTYIGNSTYVGTVNIQTTENSYFKITNSDLTWESGAGVIATLGEPMTFAISENGPVDAAQLQVTETGLYSFTLNASDRDAPVLTISKDVETYAGANLYVRGFDGDWDAHDGTQMTYLGAGYYVYDILATGDLNKGFKVANADWNAPNSGGTTVTLGGEYAMTAQSDAGITLTGLTEETEIRIIYHAIDDVTHAGEVAVIIKD